MDRLTNRGTEPQEVIDRRLETARNELAAQGEFDVVVLNDDLDATVDELARILHGA